MSDARTRADCRYCGSTRLAAFLSLGQHPPSNSFLRVEQVASERRYPLDVYVCQDCWLTQLLDVVPPELIFDDYVYLASSSKALKTHYATLAAHATERFALRAGDVVADIGCNDGILLHGYALPGLVRVGVEPSKVAQHAVASGLDVVNAFFSPEAAQQIVGRFGAAKVVTATNVFAHVDDIGRFTDGLPPLLAPEGVCIVEAPYLIDLIDQTLFDTIYHEHLCYLSLTPMAPFLARHGLDVFDVVRVPFGASGPAIRVFMQRRGGPWPVEPSVAGMLKDEAAWGVSRLERYQDYARQVEAVKTKTLELLHALRRSGKRVGGYGAPAKGNTLLNYLGATRELIECIAETNPLKQRTLTPGSHIPVVSEEEFLERMPECALLLSWNYLDFFLKQSEYIRRGGRFLVPLPAPRMVP
ncbi:MAG: methyltransferase domain-containing protein [Candidatus Omnitrophica bacterium]|nr:methyltransferase domain-containing protein [Candidatus Omnitrophota bacterium]